MRFSLNWIPSARLSGNAAELMESDPFEASVSHMNQSASVVTTAGSVTFAVDDESEINMVTISEKDAGQQYKITLNSTLESAVNQELCLAGTVMARALQFMQVNGAARYSGIGAEDGSGAAAGTTLTIDGQLYELHPVEKSLPVMSFSPNGGSGTMSPRTTAEDGTITMPACTFTPPDGKQFLCWDVDGKTLQPGEICTLTASASASARWKDAGTEDTAQKYAVEGIVVESGEEVTVSLRNQSGDGGVLMAAAYGENGKFLRFATAEAGVSRVTKGTTGSVTVSLKTTDAKTVKVFVVERETQRLISGFQEKALP